MGPEAAIRRAGPPLRSLARAIGARVLPRVVAVALAVFLIIASPSSAQTDEPAPGAVEEKTEEALPAAEADAEKLSPLERRIRDEEKALSHKFSITPHRQNYLLPFTHDSSEAGDLDPDGRDRLEIKFQLSLKVLLKRGLFKDNGHVFFAYTQQSHWQAYNTDDSSPFRETNHEPEVFVRVNGDRRVLGLRLRVVDLGLLHQSNGQSGEGSRSWNRIYAEMAFERGDFYVFVRPWFRIPEGEGDDNPDIDNYLGYGELRLMYDAGGNVFGLLVRNNLRSENRGAVQLDWSFPITDRIKGYFQFFNGYGESLIDYDRSVNRIGLGFMLNNLI